MADRRPDGELVEATLRGSREAFGELVARYKDAVFGVAFHRLGDFEQARDAAQDALIAAYLRLSALRDPSRFGPWLYRIAEGTALNAARRPRRELPLESLAEFAAPGPTPQERAEQAELAREVREALATLTEPTRLAVILHYINGYSHAEVAGFLGVSPGAVRTRLSRARRQLKEEVARTMGETLKDAAGEMRFDEQFLAGLAAALRAFGPPTASRMVSGRSDWTEMWAERLDSRALANPEEVVVWMVGVGRGIFHGGLAFLSEAAGWDPERFGANARIFAAPGRLRVLASLARNAATAAQLAEQTSRGEAEVGEDLAALSALGLVERGDAAQHKIAVRGAHLLCALRLVDLGTWPEPPDPQAL